MEEVKKREGEWNKSIYIYIYICKDHQECQWRLWVLQAVSKAKGCLTLPHLLRQDGDQ